MTTFERLLSSTAVFNTGEVVAGAGDAPIVPPTVVDVTPTAPAPAAALEVEPSEPVAPAEPEPKQSPWFMRRIAEEAEGRRKETARAEAAEKRANEAVALAERLQRQPQSPPNPSFQPATQPSQVPQAEIQRMASQMKLAEDSTEVLNRGMTTFGASFQQSLAILNAANVVNNDEFVADLIAVDRANAHIMLDKLAKEPERAATLAAMNSRQRIAELTRMSLQPPAKDAKPTAPGVSRAPAPAPHVAPSSSNVRDWRQDDASDEEFNRGFAEARQKRSKRR